MKFKEFYYRNIIKEGVHFTVADATTQPETVGDVTGKLLYSNKEVYRFFDNFSEEELQKFRKEKVMDFIAADGDSYFKDEGNINFYTAGFSEENQKKFLELIKYYIVEYNGVITGNIKKEKSNTYKSDVYRIPVKITKPDEENPPDVQLSNANARLILSDVLGYSSDTIDEYPDLNANELLYKIEQIEDNDYVITKAVRPETVDGNMYSSGLSKEDIKYRLDMLKKLCEWAVKNHYTNIRLS